MNGSMLDRQISWLPDMQSVWRLINHVAWQIDGPWSLQL